MTVSIIIPYGYQDDWRQSLYDLVWNRWNRDFPDAELITGSSFAKPFNRSEARNDGAAEATGDTFVFCDADTTYANYEAMREAVMTVEFNRGWILPREYIATTDFYAHRVLEDPDVLDQGNLPRPFETERNIDWSPGGIVVMPAEAWRIVNGYDEKFTSWGWEDSAMMRALDTLWRGHQRAGIVYHLWHPRTPDSTPDSEAWHESRARGELYRMVAESADKTSQMLRLTTGQRG